jgi:hypothetical protein
MRVSHSLHPVHLKDNMSLEYVISAHIKCVPCLYKPPAHMFVLEMRNVGRDQFIASLSDWIRSRPAPPRLAPHRVMYASYHRNESHIGTAQDLFLHQQPNACFLRQAIFFFCTVELGISLPTAQN